MKKITSCTIAAFLLAGAIPTFVVGSAVEYARRNPMGCRGGLRCRGSHLLLYSGIQQYRHAHPARTEGARLRPANPHPGKLKTPPYEETLRFLRSLKEAVERTKTPDEGGTQAQASTPYGKILRIGEGRIELLDNVCPAQLAEQLPVRRGEVLRVTDRAGFPRADLEPICDGDRVVVESKGDKQTYTAAIKRCELENLALNPDPKRIKKSSFQSKSKVTSAFDGNATGFSGSGWQTDGSQSSAAGKSTFWLALDLGEEKRIDAFGVAWGTFVGQLKKRLRDGTYRVVCTNDLAKWEAFSDASAPGRSGLLEYAAPEGWDEVYAQNVEELPDANGNKVFIQSLDEPLTARYVMVTGEQADGSIEIYNFFVFRKHLLDGAASQTEYPTEEPVCIRPDYADMTLAPGRPALIRLGTPVPDFLLAARRNLEFTARLIAPDGRTIYTSALTTVKKDETCRLSPGKTADRNGTYRMEFAFAGDPVLYDACCFTAVDEEIDRYTYAEPYPARRGGYHRRRLPPDHRAGRELPRTGWRNGRRTPLQFLQLGRFAGAEPAQLRALHPARIHRHGQRHGAQCLSQRPNRISVRCQ